MKDRSINGQDAISGRVTEEPRSMDAKLRLVLVEDREADAELVARHLSKGGLDCLIRRVQTEPTFIAALREFQPDVILSDFSMPQFEGLLALAIAVAQTPETPFIFVSGTIGEERAIDALRRGATDYVLKSNLSRLASAVERAVREASVKAARRHAEEQLRSSEQQLRATVETSQDWIWETDLQGRFKLCSGAVWAILGYDPSALLGQDFRTYLHEEDRHRAASLLPLAAHSDLTGVVARWRTADGQDRWLERNAVSILNEFGEIIGFRGTDRDITLRREQDARLQRLTRTYRMLSSTGSAILRLRNRGDLLNEVCRIAVQQGGYDRVVISLIDPGAKQLRPHAWAGADSTLLRAVERADLDSELDAIGVAEHAIRAAGPAVFNDLTAEQHPVAHKEVLIAHGYLAVAALPLIIDGTAIGVMTLFSSQREVFDEAELGVLLELTANLGFALQYLEKDEAVHFLSYFDSLTGLAKRPLFCQRLARLMSGEGAKGRSRLVVVFDLQKLGIINDSLGRYFGDRLIEAIAARLKRCYPDPDCLAHFGGGTFAVVVSNMSSTADTGRISQNEVARLFVEPFIVDGQELQLSIRSGLAYYPNDADLADTLVQNAEAALKAAREDNEKYVLYGLITQRPTTRSLALEVRLNGALEREEFLLHYQPKVSILDGRVTGFEALVRWRDSQEGIVPPSVFIPLLERSGAIVEVGEWVLAQAIRDVHHWLASGFDPVRVAVNVSPLQLRRRDFVDCVLRIIGPSNRRPAGVDIEITESMLMQDIELSIRKLTELREAGVGIAIDDFGTGYSSLRLLGRLPVSTLKVDRSFVQSMIDTPKIMTLVSTVVTLARAFDMQTVAEGVETAEQLGVLRRLRCDQAQGYLFARPTPASEVPAVLSRLLLASSVGARAAELHHDSADAGAAALAIPAPEVASGAAKR
jgi:PAS domain S-box-containing protein/diguanylate cyclase (GGDEF)-like protein